jgi:hypothetical protein
LTWPHQGPKARLASRLIEIRIAQRRRVQRTAGPHRFKDVEGSRHLSGRDKRRRDGPTFANADRYAGRNIEHHVGKPGPRSRGIVRRKVDERSSALAEQSGADFRRRLGVRPGKPEVAVAYSQLRARCPGRAI